MGNPIAEKSLGVSWATPLTIGLNLIAVKSVLPSVVFAHTLGSNRGSSGMGMGLVLWRGSL